MVVIAGNGRRGICGGRRSNQIVVSNRDGTRIGEISVPEIRVKNRIDWINCGGGSHIPAAGRQAVTVIDDGIGRAGELLVQIVIILEINPE